MQLLYIAIIMMEFEQISLHWVNRLSFVVRRELSERFKAEGYPISAEEWAVLLLLWREEGLAPSEIAERTVRDRTTITRFLDGMEKKDLLRREIDPKDRRRARVVLTENAKALQGPLSAIAKGLIDKAHQGMSEQGAKQLVTLLQKMTNNLLS